MAGFEVIIYGRFWVITEALATIPSTLPIDASALEASISALKSSICALESSLKTLEGSSGWWETLAWSCALAVGIGIVGEIVVIVGEHRDDLTAWQRGIVRPPDHPDIRRFWFDIVATIRVLIGVFGEAGASMKLASINSQLRSKTSELRADSDQLLALVTQVAAIANAGAGKANERASKNERAAAKLSLEATQEQADNLVMQKVLAVRQLGPPGTGQQYNWFAETRDFPAMDVYIQSASVKEAKNFASMIALELEEDDKWNVHWVDEKESHVSLEMMEGIDLWAIMSRNPRPPWKNDTEWVETSERLEKACWSLARAITSAGLGIGDRPLGCKLLSPRFPGDLRREGVTPLAGWAWLDPPRNGVYIQVGLRPISATVQWLNTKRKERTRKHTPNTSTKP